MSSARCPHFSFSVAQVPVLGHVYAMRMPVHHCAVAETMCQRVQHHPDGKELIAALHPLGDNAEAEYEPMRVHDHLQPSRGPDMRPLHPMTCTSERFEQHCHPQFRQQMLLLEMDATLPPTPPVQHIRRQS